MGARTSEAGAGVLAGALLLFVSLKAEAVTGA